MGERTGSIRAADVPYKPPQVDVTIDGPTGGIWITWDPASPDGNEVIDGFEIQIREDSTLTWVTISDETALDGAFPYIELGYCNGTNATIMADFECLVPMDLWVDAFFYDFQDAVFARVRAHNFYGWSEYSDMNDIMAWIR